MGDDKKILHSVYQNFIDFFFEIEIINRCDRPYGWDEFKATKKHKKIRSVKWSGQLGGFVAFPILSAYLPNLKQLSVFQFVDILP